MLNNRAQSLVIFILILPVLILFTTYVFDIVSINYEKNKMKNLTSMIEEDNNLILDDIEKLVYKNDKSINVNIVNYENEMDIELYKKVKGIFGVIIGKDYYEIKMSVKKIKEG